MPETGSFDNSQSTKGVAMTISFKQLAVAAAATITFATAQAGTYPGIVTEVFTLDAALTASLSSLGSVAFKSTGPATFDAGLGALTLTSTGTTFTAANASDLVVAAAGSGLTITTSGISVSLADMSFSAAAKAISGKLLDASGATVFTGDLLSTAAANTILAPFSLTGQGQLQTGVMRLTSGASLALAKAIAGPIGAVYAPTLAGYDFGSLKVTAVPEPSTYALMGLGLVGVALTARKRKSA
jgi:hypothetical protein